MWQHNYEPIAGSLGVSAIVAALPIVVLFVMLGVLRKPAWMSAVTALASALLVSLVVYRMPFNLAIISTIYGAAFGIFPIAWIVFASIMLYRLAVDTGKFEIIKDTIAGLTSDRRLQAMFIAFSFGAFIEGAAGFGAPVAISGAMLAGLGFNPFYAAGICLLANTAPSPEEFFENLEKAVANIDHASEGERLLIQVAQAGVDGRGDEQLALLGLEGDGGGEQPPVELGQHHLHGEV